MLEQLFHRPNALYFSSLPKSAGALGGALLLFAVLSTPGVQAQSNVSPEAPTLEGALSPTTAVWRTHFDDQVLPALTQKNEKERTRALLTLLDVARHRDEAELGATIPVLFDVYETDPNPDHRLLAARTIHAIAHYRSEYGSGIMGHLYEALQKERSAHVRRTTLELLAEYHRQRDQTLAVPAEVYVTTLGS